MKIAVIGAGNVGRALGTAWAKAGHAIVFGVRDVNKPELKSLCAQIGATAAPSAEAARQGDVVVLALPWNTAEGAVKSLGDLTGKIVIDTMNPLAMTDGALGLERGFTTSAGETVASWLPGAKVVKTFNQVGANMMTEGRRFETRPVMFLAGDDDAAKRTVSRLVERTGLRAARRGRAQAGSHPRTVRDGVDQPVAGPRLRARLGLRGGPPEGVMRRPALAQTREDRPLTPTSSPHAGRGSSSCRIR